MTDGSKANKTGKALERFVETTLQDLGYTHQYNSRKIQNEENETKTRYYMKQVKLGKTIYDTNRKADFIVFHPELFPDSLIIECKWQQTPGSVDEKYPFLIENIKQARLPTIILIDGGGYKPGALEWLIQQEKKIDCLQGVWDMKEFRKRLNNGLLRDKVQ